MRCMHLRARNTVTLVVCIMHIDVAFLMSVMHVDMASTSQ